MLRSILLFSLLACSTWCIGCSSESGDPPRQGPDGSTSGELLCGGSEHLACRQGTYCTDESCGVKTETSSCQPLPLDCGVTPQKVCGCDGKVYESWCLAILSTGAPGYCYDERCASRCTAPAGHFACGGFFCESGVEFCELVQCGTNRKPRSCTRLPAGCGATPSCACVETAGRSCQMGTDGQLTLTRAGDEDSCK